MGSDDDRDEGPNFGASVDFLLALVPELGSNLGIELDHGCVARHDGIKGLFELPLVQSRVLVVVVPSELLKDLAVVGLGHTHQIRFFNIKTDV